MGDNTHSTIPFFSPLRSLLIAIILLLTPTTGSPFLSKEPSSSSPRIQRRLSSSNNETMVTLVAVVGFIIFLVLCCICCGCCKSAPATDPVHTAACNQANTKRNKPNLHSGIGQAIQPNICTCPDGQGAKSWMRRETVPPMPRNDREIPLESIHPLLFTTQAPSQHIASIGIAPPPYSPPASGLEILKGPEPVVVRPSREQAGQSSRTNVAVWREEDGSAGAPEIKQTGHWGRWAA